MKIKLVEFIGNIGDGGAETLVKDYIQMIDPDIFETEILTIYKTNKGANYERLMESNATIKSIYRSHNCFTNILKTLFGRWYIPYKIKKVVEAEKPDIIHIHLKFLRYFAPINKVFSTNNVRLFYTCHCLPSMMLAGKNKCEAKAAKLLIEKNDLQLIALHEEMKNELDRMFGIENSIVIHNGVDYSRFKNAKAEGYKEKLGIPKDSFVIGHIGRYSYQKNQLFLLDIFNSLHKRKDNTYLLLIGHGELENEIIKKAEKLNLKRYIIMLSHRTDIPQLLKTMDVFVFPSRFEGLSVTLVEAQASGLKCVISDKVNRETILSKKTIVARLNNDPEHWCDLILGDYENAEYGDIGIFDMNNEIHRLEKLYKESVLSKLP